jgi:hypothetical protein
VNEKKRVPRANHFTFLGTRAHRSEHLGAPPSNQYSHLGQRRRVPPAPFDARIAANAAGHRLRHSMLVLQPTPLGTACGIRCSCCSPRRWAPPAPFDARIAANTVGYGVRHSNASDFGALPNLSMPA